MQLLILCAIKVQIWHVWPIITDQQWGCFVLSRVIRSTVEHGVTSRVCSDERLRWLYNSFCRFCSMGCSYHCHLIADGGTVGLPSHPASSLVCCLLALNSNLISIIKSTVQSIIYDFRTEKNSCCIDSSSDSVSFSDYQQIYSETYINCRLLIAHGKESARILFSVQVQQSTTQLIVKI